MRISKSLGMFSVAILLMSGSAHSREFADIYTECGLGAMIAPKNPAVAAVTNVTWDLGTTAISSDASSQDACKGGKEKTAAYIIKSYAALENDLANGEGEHLSALYNIMGCANVSHSALSNSLRTDFSQYVNSSVYSSATNTQKAEGMYNLVTARVSGDYAASCGAIS